MKTATETEARIMGIFFFLMGLGLGWWQIYTPIMKALRGDMYIDYYSKAVVLAPIATVLGLFLIVFGREGLQFVQKRPSKAVTILIVILVALFTFGCMLGMDWIMKSLGYS